MPSADVSGAAGRTSSFEVTVSVGGAAAAVVYSKLATGSFPAFEALAQSIVDSAK
jgi:hypothetical protein